MKTTPAKTPVAVLGATGAVGQRLVQILSRHPWFELAEPVASVLSAGKKYGEAARWMLRKEIPLAAGNLTVRQAGEPLESRIVFSALDGASAQEFEPLYAQRGHFVISNARAFRDHPDVPLLVPEINPESLELLKSQPWNAAGGGIITNPNCVVAGLVLALAPLRRAFGIELVTVVTMQALSGAGYPGIPSLEALGNVIPFIAGDEEKIETEPLKILNDDFSVSVSANRVPVADGHMASVFVRLKSREAIGAIAGELAGFEGKAASLRLPSAPGRPLRICAEPDRPQPRLDAERDGGMAVWIGRLRADRFFDVRFSLLVHNTIRGAAGAAVFNAELLVAKGLISAPAEPLEVAS